MAFSFARRNRATTLGECLRLFFQIARLNCPLRMPSRPALVLLRIEPGDCVGQQLTSRQVSAAPNSWRKNVTASVHCDGRRSGQVFPFRVSRPNSRIRPGRMGPVLEMCAPEQFRSFVEKPVGRAWFTRARLNRSRSLAKLGNSGGLFGRFDNG